MPGSRCWEPAVQEVVPSRQVLDQEGEVLGAGLWDPATSRMQNCFSSPPVVIDEVCGGENGRSL